MLIFKQVQDLQNHIYLQRSKGKTIGFAPTMGALHAGHMSLIAAANEGADISVASIFVNPTQFNEASDLDKYPRTEGLDIQKLMLHGCDVLFMPNVEEVYPKNVDTSPKFDFGDLATVMEGAHRPGHFDGVAQVVGRLLDIVQPDSLYMGQKDYQQFAIIQDMLRQMQSTIQIVRCPIIREEDGLAMSSRNVRLPEKHRQAAPRIYQLLSEAKEKITTEKPSQIEKWAMAELLKIVDAKPEYFEIVDGFTLQKIATFEEAKVAVACLACWVGDVRLIDNMILK